MVKNRYGRDSERAEGRVVYWNEAKGVLWERGGREGSASKSLLLYTKL